MIHLLYDSTLDHNAPICQYTVMKNFLYSMSVLYDQMLLHYINLIYTQISQYDGNLLYDKKIINDSNLLYDKRLLYDNNNLYDKLSYMTVIFLYDDVCAHSLFSFEYNVSHTKIMFGAF